MQKLLLPNVVDPLTLDLWLCVTNYVLHKSLLRYIRNKIRDQERNLAVCLSFRISKASLKMDLLREKFDFDWTISSKFFDNDSLKSFWGLWLSVDIITEGSLTSQIKISATNLSQGNSKTWITRIGIHNEENWFCLILKYEGYFKNHCQIWIYQVAFS